MYFLMCHAAAGTGVWYNVQSLTVMGWRPSKKEILTLIAHSVAMSGVGNAKGTGTQLQGKLVLFKIVNVALSVVQPF